MPSILTSVSNLFRRAESPADKPKVTEPAPASAQEVSSTKETETPAQPEPTTQEPAMPETPTSNNPTSNTQKTEPAATIAQLEAAFPGREKFVMDSLRGGLTMTQAYEKFPAFVAAEQKAASDDLAKKDARIQELEKAAREYGAGGPVSASTAGGGNGAAANGGKFKTLQAAIDAEMAANPKLSRGEATRNAARAHPDLYRASIKSDTSRHEAITA